ncbi:hypothetical protein DVQ87_10965 [Yersinia enterocolitica]|nr:hypothetical protein [Yersinia enterocolitica]
MCSVDFCGEKKCQVCKTGSTVGIGMYRRNSPLNFKMLAPYQAMLDKLTLIQKIICALSFLDSIMSCNYGDVKMFHRERT